MFKFEKEKLMGCVDNLMHIYFIRVRNISMEVVCICSMYFKALHYMTSVGNLIKGKIPFGCYQDKYC